MLRLSLAAGLVAACGVSYDAAVEEEAAATCEVLVTCFGVFDDVETCRANLPVDDGGCDTPDPVAVRDCLDALDALVETCPDDLLGWSPPEACDRMCADPGSGRVAGVEEPASGA